MLNAITLTNFKCFQDQRIDFRPLTLLTGVNSAGKSTVIQSLLLLQQNFAPYWEESENGFLPNSTTPTNPFQRDQKNCSWPGRW